MRIVVADDSDDVRLTLRLVLATDTDADVVGEAANGEEVVTVAAEHQPDIVVVDLGMPGPSGADLVGRLRRAAPAASIIVYSGRPANAVDDLGADTYVEKGSVDAIVATVARISGERRA